eukprot:7776378-Prorocentrum_lima.AAC.1
MLRQAAEENPSPEINVQLQYWSMLLENIHKNAPIARAADWVGTLGEHVYLLYGHPKCLWKYTFWSRQN